MSKPRRPRSKKRAAVSIALLVLVGVIFFFLQGPGRRLLNRLDLPLLRGWGFTSVSISEESAGLVFGGVPRGPEALVLLENRAYLAAYDETRRNPAWVAYRIPGRVRFRNHERPEDFSVDERTRSRVASEDFTRSGYSRGHLAPSYAIYSRFGKKAQAETFLMSNIAPQLQGMNGGVWRSLEYRVAGDSPGDDCWSRAFGELWVIAGPVYDRKRKRLKSGVEIPDAFFKIVVDVDEGGGGVRVLAFLVPNRKRPPELSACLVPVDEIESRTGLDFFPDLDDGEEEALERRTPSALWN
jgi:endonuclease G